jgi:hypothetical protein
VSLHELIKQFAIEQIKAIGYEKYMVRSAAGKDKDKHWLHWVDIYTRSGLIIKTKLSSLSDIELSSFIGCTIEKLCSQPAR